MTETLPPVFARWRGRGIDGARHANIWPRTVTSPPEPSAFLAVTVPETCAVPPAVSQTWPLIVLVPVAETMPPLFPASA